MIYRIALAAALMVTLSACKSDAPKDEPNNSGQTQNEAPVEAYEDTGKAAEDAKPEAVAFDRKAALDSKDPVQLTHLALVAGASRVVSGDASRGLANEFTWPKPDGSSKNYTHEGTIGLRSARSAMLRMIRDLAPSKVEGRCDTACFDTLVNTIVEPAIGAPLFSAPGKVDPKGLEALLEKTWIAPETEVLGVKASDAYGVFRHSVRQYASVQKTMDIKAARKGFDAALKEHGETKALVGFYRRYANESGLKEKLDESYHRRINDAVGFWMRRNADGTDAILAKHLDKTLAAYDAEFKAGL